MLDARGIIRLIPAVKSGTVKKAVAEFKKEAVFVHRIIPGGLRTEFTLIIQPAKDKGDVRETATGYREGESESAYHTFATSVSPNGGRIRLEQVCRDVQAKVGDRDSLPAPRACAAQDH